MSWCEVLRMIIRFAFAKQSQKWPTNQLPSYRIILFQPYPRPLFHTHWGQDKMDAISQTTSLNAFSGMEMYEFQLRFHWSLFLSVNIPVLVQIMAWRRPGDKPLSEPMMVKLMTHICATRPQWVKTRWNSWLLPWFPNTTKLPDCPYFLSNTTKLPDLPVSIPNTNFLCVLITWVNH